MIGDFLSGAGKAFGLLGKGISKGAGFLRGGSGLSGTAQQVKSSLTRIGIGALGFAGINSVANAIESNEELSNRVGGFWTGAARVGAGLTFGLSTGNNLSNLAGKIGLTASKSSMVKNAFTSEQITRIQAVSRNLRDRKPFSMGAKKVGKFMGEAAIGVAKSPFMPLYDISRIAHKGTKYLNESHGARAIGWGALAGSGTLALNIANDEVNQSNSGRNMALGGKQMYIPTSGQGPRRMTDNLESTSGLTLALHKLK